MSCTADRRISKLFTIFIVLLCKFDSNYNSNLVDMINQHTTFVESNECMFQEARYVQRRYVITSSYCHMIFSLECLVTEFFSYRDYFVESYFEVVIDYYLDCTFEGVLRLANKLTKVYNLYIY